MLDRAGHDGRVTVRVWEERSCPNAEPVKRDGNVVGVATTPCRGGCLTEMRRLLDRAAHPPDG